MAVLSDNLKDAIRYHLEYPLLDTSVQTWATAVMFNEIRTRLELQMNHVSTTAETRLQQNIDKLDLIETQMIDALERMQVDKADVVTLNKTEELDLLGQYRYWQTRICSMLAVSVNPYSERFNAGVSSHSLNFRVR